MKCYECYGNRGKCSKSIHYFLHSISVMQQSAQKLFERLTAINWPKNLNTFENEAFCYKESKFHNALMILYQLNISLVTVSQYITVLINKSWSEVQVCNECARPLFCSNANSVLHS